MLVPQFSMYGGVPPLIFSKAVPLLPLAHDTSVVWGITSIGVGWLIVAVSLNWQPKESVMV